MQNAGHPVNADYLTSAQYRPQINVDEDLWGGRLEWYRDWISHPKGTVHIGILVFWGMLKNIPSHAKVPMLIHEGWFDHHLGSALTGYETLPETIKQHSWLRIGCWNHYFLNPLEGIEPSQLEASELPAALEWFDITLRQGITPDRRIEYYEIGSDTLHTASSWPLPLERSAQSVFYLSSDTNEDIQNDEARTLSQTPDLMNDIKYDYDPNNPVPTHGGEALLTSMDQIGALIQPEPGWRDDVINFVSDIFTQDPVIQGRIHIDLYVSSSAPDTAFTAKLMCVDPDGTTRNYRSSITTMVLDGHDEKPYIPGEIRKVEIEMWDICWEIPVGARLRCDISSSDFPQYSVHANTADPWCEQKETVVAHQTIHTGETTPSAIVLPVRVAKQ